MKGDHQNLGGDVGSLRSYPAMTTVAVPAGTGSTLYSGAGAPPTALGINGDVFFRSDTPGTANQRMYVKSAGAWVGVV